jgi:hypothetical protein
VERKSSITVLDKPALKFRPDCEPLRLAETFIPSWFNLAFSNIDVDVVPAAWGGFSKEYKRLFITSWTEKLVDAHESRNTER